MFDHLEQRIDRIEGQLRNIEDKVGIGLAEEHIRVVEKDNSNTFIDGVVTKVGCLLLKYCPRYYGWTIDSTIDKITNDVIRDIKFLFRKE